MSSDSDSASVYSGSGSCSDSDDDSTEATEKVTDLEEHQADLAECLAKYLAKNQTMEASKVKDIMVPSWNMQFAGKLLLEDAAIKCVGVWRWGFKVRSMGHTNDAQTTIKPFLPPNILAQRETV